MIFLVNRSFTSLRGFTTVIERTPDKLSIKYEKTYTDPDNQSYTYTYNASTITLDYLKSRKDFADYTSFGLYARESVLTNVNMITDLFEMAERNHWYVNGLKNRLAQLFKDADNKYPYSATNLINLTATTLSSKSDYRGIRTVVSGSRLLRFFVPFTDMNFTQFPVVVALCPGSNFNCNEDTQLLDNDNDILHPDMDPWILENTIIPKIELESENKDKSISNDINKSTKITVRLLNKYDSSPVIDHPSTIYLENINGYISKNRVVVDPETGTATFNVLGLGLDKDDTVEIKAGFKYYTGLAKATYIVK